MKICPECGNRYQDDMSFCLQDGKSLVEPEMLSNSEAKTLDLPEEAIPKSDSHLSMETMIRSATKDPYLTNKNQTAETLRQIKPEEQKSRKGILIGALAFVGLLLFGTAIGVGYFYMKNQGENEIALVNSNKTEPNISIKDSNTKGEAGASEFSEDNSKTNTNSVENKKTPEPTKSPKETPKPTASKTPLPSPSATPDLKPTPTPRPTQTPPQGKTSDLKILSKPKANMTVKARRNKTQGVVILKVTFQANGQIGNISVVKGLPHGLTRSAAMAAKGIRFTPAMKNGVPYSVTKQIAYRFTIY